MASRSPLIEIRTFRSTAYITSDIMIAFTVSCNGVPRNQQKGTEAQGRHLVGVNTSDRGSNVKYRWNDRVKALQNAAPVILGTTHISRKTF